MLLHLATTDMTLAWLLGPQLKAFISAGYDVVGAAAPGDYQAEIEELGVTFEPLRNATRSMAPLKDLKALFELWQMFRRLQPDIVHTHNPKPGWYGRLAARLAGVPKIVNTVHGLYALPDDRRAKRLVVYGLERAAASCSDVELVQNPEDIDVLRRIGVDARKLRLLGNGIDLSRFRAEAIDPQLVDQSRSGFLAGTAPTATRPTIICGVVGRLVWEKGLQEVLDAALSLRQSHPQLQFVLVGPTDPAKSDGLRATDLERLAAETGIHFAGERHDMEVVYASFDLFALASYREGFPRAAMEASAMGLPVVATDIRGCRQVVDNEVTGLLVPPRDSKALADAIARLAEEPELRRIMGQAAQQKALQEFDQQRVIDLSLATYKELLGS